MVVMGIIAMLIAILLPALMQARAASRRMTCLNHLRQVALAVTMSTDQHGRLPAAGHFSTTGKGKHHSWVTTILPQLDQANLAQQYDLSKAYTVSENFELTRTDLPVLTCPDDVSLMRGEGNLSYVVNGGPGWTIPVDCLASMHVESDQVKIAPLDLNGNGIVCPIESEPGPGPTDLQLFQDMSLFFVENWPSGAGTVRYHRFQDVTDGMTTTLMLAENMRSGFDPDHQSSWGSPEPLRNMFFVSSSICEKRQCKPEQIDLNNANAKTGLPASKESLNSAISQAEGTAPWPSSGHPGLVHVAWCDGHVSPLSEFVDGKIYFAMVTPRGTQGKGAFGEPLVTRTNY